jgi:hypothetical protein
MLANAMAHQSAPGSLPSAPPVLQEMSALVTQERQLSEALRTRAVGLAGFTGLTATFAASLFTSSFHGPLVARIIAFALLTGALVGLVTGVVMLVEVIAPKEGARLITSDEQISQWKGWMNIPADHFSALRMESLVEVLHRAEATTKRLSRGLRRARIPIIIGLALTAAETILVAYFATGLG